MEDKAQIQEAYGAMIQLLFKVFFESFTAAHGVVASPNPKAKSFMIG